MPIDTSDSTVVGLTRKIRETAVTINAAGDTMIELLAELKRTGDGYLAMRTRVQTLMEEVARLKAPPPRSNEQRRRDIHNAAVTAGRWFKGYGRNFRRWPEDVIYLTSMTASIGRPPWQNG